MTSPANLKNLLKAVEAVKQDFTCGICSELCKDPVTLSACFHIICGEHFEGLKFCPTCCVSLEDCTTYVDDRLQKSIEAARDLDRIFDPYKNLNESEASSLKSAKQKGATKNESAIKSAEPPSSSKIAEPQSLAKTAGNKTNQTTKSNANTSLLSANSKFSKTTEKRNIKGETILHIACRLGKISKVSELLGQGANTNTKDNAGWTPLHEVVQNGNLELVSLLLQHNTLIDVPGQSNETPLHEAVRYNHKEIAEVLVKNGANIHARNCKGETPLELASSEMKDLLLSASECIIQTQSVNINLISALYTELDSDDIRVFCISQFRTVQSKLKSLAKSHSNLHIEAKLTKKVTHLIVDAEDNGVCQSSLDILQAVVDSKWILSIQWVTKSNEDQLEPFEQYEVTGIGSTSYQGPKNSRYNKYKQLPGIFDGCFFYLHNFNVKYEISEAIVVTKAILSKLITDAGGRVLRRVPNPELIPDEEKLVPYHAQKGGKLFNCSHYIIFKDMSYEPMYNMKHLKALPVGWLIECLEKYELCDPW